MMSRRLQLRVDVRRSTRLCLSHTRTTDTSTQVSYDVGFEIVAGGLAEVVEHYFSYVCETDDSNSWTQISSVTASVLP